MSGLVERLRSSAAAFRKHNVYTQDGDPVRLTVQAHEAEEAADVIEHLKRFAEHHTVCPAGRSVWAIDRKCSCEPYRAACCTGGRVMREPHICTQCGGASKFEGRCADCIIADFDDYDDDYDPEGPAFECAGFNDGTGFYCPLWGTEECDWECPKGGMG